MSWEKHNPSMGKRMLKDTAAPTIFNFPHHLLKQTKPTKASQSIVAEQYEVDTMYRAGPNRFYTPTVKIPGDKVWYFPEDIKEVIPEPMPATSSARHF
ncbi:hypothetical protein INR49_018960, partial [Caranx melampygus]